MDSASYQMKGNGNKGMVYLTLEIFKYIFNNMKYKGAVALTNKIS